MDRTFSRITYRAHGLGLLEAVAIVVVARGHDVGGEGVVDGDEEGVLAGDAEHVRLPVDLGLLQEHPAGLPVQVVQGRFAEEFLGVEPHEELGVPRRCGHQRLEDVVDNVQELFGILKFMCVLLFRFCKN